MTLGAGLNSAPRLLSNRRRWVYGDGTSRWACAAMRWLCCFKTSGQLVSRWTGGVEGDCHRCSDLVCLDVCGGYWLSRALDRIQAKV